MPAVSNDELASLEAAGAGCSQEGSCLLALGFREGGVIMQQNFGGSAL